MFFFQGLSYWALPGGEGAWEQWRFSEIIKQDFAEAKLGEKYGPTWTTHWFKVSKVLSIFFN